MAAPRGEQRRGEAAGIAAWRSLRRAPRERVPRAPPQRPRGVAARTGRRFLLLLLLPCGEPSFRRPAEPGERRTGRRVPKFLLVPPGGARDLLAPSGETPSAPALPAAEGHRGHPPPRSPAAAEGYTALSETQPAPSRAAPRRRLLPLPLHRERRGGSRSGASGCGAGTAAATRPMTARSGGGIPPREGNEARAAPHGRVCGEEVPLRDPSARCCPLNAGDSPPRGAHRDGVRMGLLVPPRGPPAVLVPGVREAIVRPAPPERGVGPQTQFFRHLLPPTPLPDRGI